MKQQIMEENEAVVRRFRSFLKTGRLAHAYLFVGPRASGKSETALSVAKLINCEQQKEGCAYCGMCPSCHKIQQNIHPDVHVLVVDQGSTIKIDQIRQMLREMQLSPFESQKKIFIIKDADLLTLEASNALLKTLEEPTSKSLIILTTPFPEKILDTIKSRCHAVKFFSSNSLQLKEKLIRDFRLDEETAHFFANFSGGCLGQALRLHEERFFQEKNEAIDRFILMRHDEMYIRELLADKDKEHIQKILDVLLSWFRDLMFLQLNIEQIKLINSDRIKDLQRSQGRYTMDELGDIIQDIVMVARSSKENFNIKMALTLLKERI